MPIAVVANGELERAQHLQELWRRASWRIAADGGARNARLCLGGPPDVVIGDLDSLDPETDSWLDQHKVERILHPRKKDESDLELALNLAFERADGPVTILGVFGGRTDHYISNVMLLARTPGLRAADAHGEMWAATGEAVVTGRAGDLVSLLPFDDEVPGVVTEGLEYPLRHETLFRGSTRGISNVMLGPRARITWDRGLMLVTHAIAASE